MMRVRLIIITLLVLFLTDPVLALDVDHHSASQSQYHIPDSIVNTILSSLLIPDYGMADFYSYALYSKSSLALNDVDLLNTGSKFLKKHPRLRGTVEKNNLNDKFVLPLMSEQKVTQIIGRKNPKKQISHVLAINREDFDEVINGDALLDMYFGSKFLDFSIFDDTLYFDKNSCVSPIGRNAMGHYDYILESYNDSVARILFDPKKGYSEGVSGFMTLVKDSIWRMKLVHFSIPVRKFYRHVDKLYISQEYGMSPQGYVLKLRDDCLIELRRNKTLGQLCYISSEQYSHFSFDSIPDRKFRNKSTLKYDGMSEYRAPEFWAKYDSELALQLQNYRMEDSLHCSQTKTDGEKVVRHHQSSQQKRINDILDLGGHNKWLCPFAVTAKAFFNDYIEVANPPLFNVEPVSSLVSYNGIDGWRLRFGGNTTANLNRRLFLGGYVAYGTSVKNVYYQAHATYSFNDKAYEPSEFPRRNINIESRHDICYLGERNTHVDHDNIFKSFHWDKDSRMMFFNLQRIEFERDERCGICYRFSVKREEDRATGGLVFKSMHDILFPQVRPEQSIMDYYHGTLDNGTVCTTELRFEVLYSPSRERFANTKSRVPVNNECPSIALAHTIGVKFLGGGYQYHLTELNVRKDWYLGTLGIAHSTIRAGALWNTVPYPLLLAPPAEISYITNPDAFSLISTSGFINDRYMSLMLSWETNGNVVGLIHAIKKFRWKEYLAVRMLWGGLHDANNPTLIQNWRSNILMPLPSNVYVMDPKVPYIEGVIGIHNICHVLDVDYVRRFTYRDIPNANLGGFRFSVHLNF